MLNIETLFDEGYYTSLYPDVAQAVTNGNLPSALQHYQQYGRFENRKPGTMFDPEFYINKYADVKAAIAAGQITAIDHFINNGEFENRDPITEFSSNYYLANSLDVKAAVERQEITAIEHFIKFGQYENRNPSTNFDNLFYLRQNLDVAATVRPGGLSALKHYIQFGQSEERLSRGVPEHPLEPLQQAEIKAVISAIRQQQNLSDSALFPSLSLQDPIKQEVLNFTDGNPVKREAFVTVIERQENKVYEAKVDLNSFDVTSWQEIPGIQPTLLDIEYEELTEIVKADPRWQQAMLKRGITNFDDVEIDGWAPGILSNAERESGSRFIRGLSYFRGNNTNFYARPIEGVLATVNLNTGTVENFLDTGVVPVPTANYDYDEASVGQLRPAPTPLIINQPEGASFEINNNQISWENWKLRYTIDPRTGLVLHQVGYEDAGQLRPIMYRGSLSEMVVPYADTSETWTFRNAFDVGEYGLGKLSNTLELGKQVPENAVLLDAIFADDFGEPYVQPDALGIYERDSGLLWQHYDEVTGTTEVVRGRDLVMTFVVTIGNYDYGINWIFHQDGSMEVETALTGQLLVKATPATNPNTTGAGTGTIVAPNLEAPNHQHFFNFRLDMDVDGVANSAVETSVKALPAGANNPAGNGFVESEMLLTNEAMAQRDLNFEEHREWEIINSEKENSLGGEIGYALHPGENSVPYASPNSSVRQRAGFINHPVWVTQYKPGELYAGGDYPNQSIPGQGLTQWVEDNDSLEKQDIVLWYTLGVTHISRPEDFPVMPVEKAGFKLAPVGFFTRNPAIDVPRPSTISQNE